MTHKIEPDGPFVNPLTHTPAPPAALSRRTVLKAGTAAVGLGALALGAARVQAQTQAQSTPAASTAAASPAACVLTPELTEGPYYVPNELVRKDITEGKPGVPLRLRIAVLETTGACAPLANAAVDIWHCDALGYYSGITGENPGGGGTSPTTETNAHTTFLRGIQLTDASGIVEFQTIYPGWYTGRTVHIHLKVHAGGAAGAAAPATPATAAGTAGQTYVGGHVDHTGQLFFDDATSDAVFKLAPYATHTGNRTTNAGDNILDGHAGAPGFLVALTPLKAGSPADGFLGTITLGVDPNATPSASGPGGGGPGGPPPGGG